ncbi:ABC transporter permease [Tessaracoccus defluvii]|uniref:ABC transporter permease n=1 Tax=Tessaracoccus defluvii TaxID=1285901 RepID=A0A7H0H701_9ACTN|nr:ABC transporter permease [Tessaracoccus defluvii]QNP56317.1 ABC transporter permease [Tessaracoccus defluvii]
MTSQERRSALTLSHLGVWSAFPGRTRPGRLRLVPALVVAAVLVLVWWAVTAAGLIAPLYLPAPGEVVARMAFQVQSGLAWRYLAPTLAAALLGMGIAVAVGLPLGYLATHSRLLGAVVEPFIAVSQTVPLVAIAPLLVLWIGYGTVPIAILCAIVAFFPMVTTTVVGLRSLDMRTIETALLDGTNWWQRLVHVEGPMAAPAVLAGVRGGVVLSMTGAVVGELVMGGAGLGTLLTLARDSADTAAVFAVVAWISLTALAFHALVQLLERAAVHRLQGESS